MDAHLLSELLAARDNAVLQRLIEIHSLDVQTIQALKDHSAQFYFDRPEEAVRVAQVAFQLGQRMTPSALALGAWTLANALMFVDRYQEAVDLFGQAHRLYLAADDQLSAARLGIGYVWGLAYVGQFEQALGLAAEIEPVLVASAKIEPTDRRRLSGLYNNLGIIHDLLGRYEEALGAYDRKLEIVIDLGNEVDVARTHHNRACVLIYLNAFNEAENAFNLALPILHTHQALPDLARLAFNRGVLYARWERYAEAEGEFRQAEDYLTSLGEAEQFRTVLRLYRALARIIGKVAPDESMIADLEAAQRTLAAHGPLFEEGLAWLGLGRCRLLLNDSAAAYLAFTRALKLADQSADRTLAYAALHGLGNWSETYADLARARNYYEQALSRVETIRHDLQISVLRASFLTDKLAIYEDLAALHLRLGQREAALETIERAKSRLLAERLSIRLHTDIDKLDTVLDITERNIAQRLRELLVHLDQLYRQEELVAFAGRDDALALPPAVSNAADIARLEDEVVHLSQQLEQQWPRFTLALTNRAPLADLSVVAQDELLLDYYIAHGRVHAFVVDRAGVRAHYDLAALREIEVTSRRLVSAMERMLGLSSRYGLEVASRYVSALQADVDVHLASLYDQLVRPLADMLIATSAIIISPASFLHRVPFQALFDGKAYLLERYTVSYTPSITILDLCARQKMLGYGWLLAGYGGEWLPSVPIELAALQELLPEALCLSESQATVEQVTTHLPHHRFIHLAAHAHFRADNSLLSALTLANRSLTLAEISQLNLNADLVTLSGCETGRGQLQGADLFSLASSFLGAGARSLLVSLWRVDDESTVQLMTDFYRMIKGGMTKAAALREAQLHLLSAGQTSTTTVQRVYSHPAYWASFVLMGEPHGGIGVE